MDLITQYLNSRGLYLSGGKSITVLDAQTKDWGEGWDEEDYRGFIQTVSQAWFNGKVYKRIVDTFGTPAFEDVWLDYVFNYYKSKGYGNHAGILLVGATEFQYVVKASQLKDSGALSRIGMLYYPNMTQAREVAPQITLN